MPKHLFGITSLFLSSAILFFLNISSSSCVALYSICLNIGFSLSSSISFLRLSLNDNFLSFSISINNALLPVLGCIPRGIFV